MLYRHSIVLSLYVLARCLYLSGTRICSEFSCYLLVETVQSWDAAKDHCESLGGFLADIKSQEEQEFLDKTLLSKSSIASDNVWIGGTDCEEEGVFVWLDGTSVASGYVNWIPGDPNNGLNAEHCMETFRYHNNKWNDKKCSEQRASICEFK
ncbi:ladderlectin-like [Mercenaria mercenaria]|uniref:ladderlectin-like n=1 Tax=Mercenaria mercenaria TaxID=6596 RepID=UPI00234E5BBF|nr:ladderlectin-like [Mercenaria mercenaria]